MARVCFARTCGLALLAAVAVGLPAAAAHAQAAPAPAADAPAAADTAAEAPPTTHGEGDSIGASQSGSPIPNVGVQVNGGPGFALTPDRRSRLHLGIDVGGGLDTNPYAVPLQEAAFEGDLVARVRPRVDVDYPGSLLAFQGQGLIDYGVLPGIIDKNTQSFLLYQSLLSAELEVNRGGAVGFALGDTFSWNSDPGQVSLGTIFNRITDDLRAGVGVRPGGGALDLRLSYDFAITKYLDPGNLTAGGLRPGNLGIIDNGDLDNFTNTLTLRADYKFLPKTGFFALASAGWNTYINNVTGAASGAGHVQNPDSFPVTAMIGVQGQLLAKVAGLVSLGYSNPLVYDTPAAGGGQQIVTGTLIGAVGQAEVQWLPTPVTRLGVGFKRSFSPAPLYQYLGNNRFYANATQMIGGRFLLAVNAGYSLLELGQEQTNLTQFSTGNNNGLGRFDQHLDALASISYFFLDWVSLGVTNRFDWHNTNAIDSSTINVAGITPTNLSYIRNQTVVLASVFY